MFIDEMVPHHEGAIVMAQAVLANAQHPELKTLARDIIKTQSEQNAQMNKWKGQWSGCTRGTLAPRGGMSALIPERRARPHNESPDCCQDDQRRAADQQPLSPCQVMTQMSLVCSPIRLPVEGLNFGKVGLLLQSADSAGQGLFVNDRLLRFVSRRLECNLFSVHHFRCSSPTPHLSLTTHGITLPNR